MHAWLDTLLELGIFIILIVEYQYDKHLNEHVKSLKRRTKQRFEFDNLSDGEGK